MNSANKTSAKKYSWNFQKKWVRLEHGCVKKSPKKRAPTKKTDNSTGNRTPGLQWIIGFPSSITYTLNRSSEVQTNGNPYLVKFTTEKKTWLKSTLPLAYWKRPCCTFASPNLPRKSQLSWDFIKTKTIGVTKKERIKMLKFSLTVFLCFYPRKKKWTRQHFQYSAREVYKLAEKKILKRAREKK